MNGSMIQSTIQPVNQWNQLINHISISEFTIDQPVNQKVTKVVCQWTGKLITQSTAQSLSKLINSSCQLIHQCFIDHWLMNQILAEIIIVSIKQSVDQQDIQPLMRRVNELDIGGGRKTEWLKGGGRAAWQHQPGSIAEQEARKPHHYVCRPLMGTTFGIWGFSFDHSINLLNWHIFSA